VCAVKPLSRRDTDMCVSRSEHWRTLDGGSAALSRSQMPSERGTRLVRCDGYILLSQIAHAEAHLSGAVSCSTAPQRWHIFCAAPFGSGTFFACDTCAYAPALDKRDRVPCA